MQCERCNTTITEQTVRIYHGRCVPCHRQRSGQRWSRMLQDIRLTVGGILSLPLDIARGLPSLPKAMMRFFLRRAYAFAIRRGFVRSLASFLPLWAASDAIYLGPSGAGASVYPELLALRQIISCPSIADADLYARLSHANPWVVGYCFEALLARGSSLLTALPQSLSTRTEPVSMGLGCLRFIEPLHSYITHRMAAEPRTSSHDQQQPSL